MSFRQSIHSARRALTIAATLAVCATTATNALAASPAAQVLQQPNVSLALANELINATLAACRLPLATPMAARR